MTTHPIRMGIDHLYWSTIAIQSMMRLQVRLVVKEEVFRPPPSILRLTLQRHQFDVPNMLVSNTQRLSDRSSLQTARQQLPDLVRFSICRSNDLLLFCSKSSSIIRISVLNCFNSIIKLFVSKDHNSRSSHFIPQYARLNRTINLSYLTYEYYIAFFKKSNALRPQHLFFPENFTKLFGHIHYQ